MSPCQTICRLLLQAPFHCAICMEAVPGTACFVLQPCQHRFCRDCLLQHLSTQVASRTFPIRCAQCMISLLICHLLRCASRLMSCFLP